MAKKKGNNYIKDEANGIAKIELHRRKGENLLATIDLEDLERVINFPYTWYAKYNHTNDCFYVYSSPYCPETQKCNPLYLHQFIMNAEGKTVDHMDNDTFNNRKSNLRISTNSDNLKNRKSKNKNNTSGYRNVSWSKSENKWLVQLQINKKNTVLGKFDNVHEAGEFAAEMREKYYGEFAGKN